MDLPQKIGQRIKTLRLEKGFSQEKLAFKADIGISYIGAIERGEKNVTVLYLSKILVALDISLGDFFKEIK